MPLAGLNIKGLDKATAAIKKLGKSGTDLTRPFQIAIPLMITSVEKNFQAGGRPAWEKSKKKRDYLRGLQK